jgi:hypothetical protein
MSRAIGVALAALVLARATVATAQQAQPAPGDGRAQYPLLLRDSYVSINLGWIGYAFSASQLQPGVQVQTVSVPHAAVRVAIFGHEFSRFLSVQGTYLRPVQFVSYRGLSVDGSSRHVWTHFGGVTAKARLPLDGRVSLYGEGGFGITSRHGFNLNGAPVVRDANYGSMLAGGGLEYHVDSRWDLTAGALYSPGRPQVEQPHMVFVSGGIRYTMRPLPPDRVAENAASASLFPRHVVQFEYSTGYGYGINTFLSKDLPVFWGGNVKTVAGLAGHYQQNVFHTRRVFALDVGASVGAWRSRLTHESFVTVSAYPLLRFTVLRRRDGDVFFTYSLAGPTYISRTIIDGLDTGHRFTFQDFLGAGVFVGAHRRTSIEVKINHYSNGNIFTENAGIKVPLTVAVGRTF